MKLALCEKCPRIKISGRVVNATSGVQTSYEDLLVCSPRDSMADGPLDAGVSKHTACVFMRPVNKGWPINSTAVLVRLRIGSSWPRQ